MSNEQHHETVETQQASGKKPAGSVHTDGHILAWSYQDGHAVRVTCDRENGTDGIWHLAARVGNRPVVSGQVYGGKTVAREVTIYLRNGLTRYTMHNRKKRLARNLAKKAAEAANNHVNPVQNHEGK